MASKPAPPAEASADKKGSDDAKIEQAMKDSPYVQFDDLEDYKRQAYGTEGHQEVQPGRGAGATEGPTESGADASTKPDASATETIKRKGSIL